jgi:NADH-quinone oxidoreductase subunit M
MLSILSLFLIPFICAILILIAAKVMKNRDPKNLALVFSLIPLAALLYHPHQWIGSSLDFEWLPALSIHFALSIDRLSLLFLFLVALITPIAIAASPKSEISNPNIYYSIILFLQGILIGFFTAQDLVLFTFFWETMLLPLFVMIALWGGSERMKAATQFLIYMIAGSILMIAGLLFLYFASMQTGSATFNLTDLALITSSIPHATWIAAIFMLAFIVKTPLFPFHLWLPDAYCQAPIAGTILLSALLSKVGIYGIIRVGLGLFPEVIQEWSPVLIGLSITGVLYGAFAAWMQLDFKKLIAYSSLSHVNFILVGLFVGNSTALSGAVLQVINHSITITGLFLVAFWLERRIQSSLISSYSGLAVYLPKLCWITLIFILSSVALPGTNTFIGEFLILFGLFQRNGWVTPLLGLSLILSAIYMLRWMQKVYFETQSPFQAEWIDINLKEIMIMMPLLLLIFWIGLYPNPILKEISMIEQPVYKQEAKAYP